MSTGENPGLLEATLAQAQRGDAEAMFRLAALFRRGEVCKRDPQQAFLWCKRAAEAENVQAMFLLSLLYSQGDGCERDSSQAFHWCNKAALANHADAMFHLSEIYYRSEGSDKLPLAFLWCSKSAQAGNAEAMLVLSSLYRKGVGCEADPAEAFAWCRKAAQAGNAVAMFALSNLFRQGDGCEADAGEAFLWCSKAAQAGHPEAMYALSTCYSQGQGCSPDPAEAFAWCRKAAKADHLPAMLPLSAMYALGDGCEKDLQRARVWCRSGITSGDAACRFWAELLDWAATDAYDALRSSIWELYGVVRRAREEQAASPADLTLSCFLSRNSLLSMLELTPDGRPVEGRNRLRLYHSAYLDDPREGKALWSGKGNPLDRFFHDWQPENDGLGVFCTTLSAAPERLESWQNHARNGEDVRLEIPFDSFSDDPRGAPVSYRSAGKRQPDLRLFRVDQDSARKGKFLKDLTPLLRELTSQMKSMPEPEQNRLRQLVFSLFGEITCLFKDEPSVGGQEFRLLALQHMRDAAVRQDDSPIPRLFVETRPFLFLPGTRLLVSPELGHREWMALKLNLEYRLARHGFTGVIIQRSDSGNR